MYNMLSRFPEVGKTSVIGISEHEHVRSVGVRGKGIGKGGDRFVGKSGVLHEVRDRKVRFDEGKVYLRTTHH